MQSTGFALRDGARGLDGMVEMTDTGSDLLDKVATGLGQPQQGTFRLRVTCVYDRPRSRVTKWSD